jgi:predicted HicB family RNase H-like nuclease
MPPTSRNVLLGVRVPPELKDAVQAYADAQGISLAAAVNILLRQALGEFSPAGSTKGTGKQ